jgi:hypothetical protein
MATPELKLKKIAREATLTKARAEEAKKAEAAAAAKVKSITAKAKSYEEEYAKVR